MKSLLDRVAAAFRPAANPRPPAGPTDGFKVFVRIDESLMADRRIRKYEKPLHAALMLARLGHVVGGGSVQGTDGTIHWVSLELRLRDLEGALHFACAKLRELGARETSTVKFEYHGRSITRPIA